LEPFHGSCSGTNNGLLRPPKRDTAARTDQQVALPYVGDFGYHPSCKSQPNLFHIITNDAFDVFQWKTLMKEEGV
jgi:hypothetical protein